METETTMQLLDRIYNQHFSKPLSGRVDVVATLGDHLGHSINKLECLRTLIQRIIFFLVSVHGGHDSVKKHRIQTGVARAQGCGGTLLFHTIVEMIIFRAALFWPRLSDATQEQVLSRMNVNDAFGEFLDWFVHYAVELKRLQLDNIGVQLFHAKLALCNQHIMCSCDQDTCHCPSAMAFTCMQVDHQLAEYFHQKAAVGNPEQWPDPEDMVDVPQQMAMAFESHFLNLQPNEEDCSLLATLFSEN